MPKLLTSEQNYNHIANAIRARLDNGNSFLPSEMNGAISGIKTIPSSPNGVGRRDVTSASGNIPANSFIEVVRESLSEGILTGDGYSIIGSTTTSVAYCALDDKRVVVFWVASSVCYACVITLTGIGTMSVGGTNTVSITTNSYLSAVAISSSRIALVHGTNVKVSICEVSGDTVTSLSDTTISTTRNLPDSSTERGKECAVAIDSSKIFIMARGNSNAGYKPYGIVCTISGTTVTPGTETLLSSLTFSFLSCQSVSKIDSSKVFIAYKANDNDAGYKPYGMVCTISGTTITPGADTLLYDEAATVSNNSLVGIVLSSTTAFVQWENGTDNALYGVACALSNTTITPGTRTALTTGFSPDSNKYNVSSVSKIDSTHVLSIYINSYSRYGMVSEISGSAIVSVGDSVLCVRNSYYNNQHIGAAVLGGQDAVIITAGVTSGTMQAQLIYGPIAAKMAESKVDGMTSQDITTTTPGDVWIWEDFS